jgi:prepilin-type N-terminal cleavage/methylation domain-containing protein
VKTKQAFSLIEVLVAVALLTIVLLLVFRGFVAVSNTVTIGHRASQVQRTLENARRVMQEDFSMMVLHPRWPILASTGAEDGPDLAFLRYRPGREGETETEWVQYWRVPHPDTAKTNVTQWVRYAGPADNRHDIQRPDWWAQVNTNVLSGEILIDVLLTAEIQVRLESGAIWSDGWSGERPATLDVRLAATIDPLPSSASSDGEWLQRVRLNDGGWIHFRTQPSFDPGPVGDL